MVSSQFEAIISPYCIKYLKLIWKMLPEFALEARFTVSEKGIQVEAINPGSAVYVQIDFARFLQEFKRKNSPISQTLG